MQNTAYYGEIVAKISAHLHQSTDHITRITRVIDSHPDTGDTIWTVCAEAGRVLDQIEDLSGEHLIDWHQVSDSYAGQVLDHLLSGNKPYMVDFVSMVARSIEASRASHFQSSQR